MIGNLIELQFGQGKELALGAALAVTMLLIVLVALIFYMRISQRSGKMMFNENFEKVSFRLPINLALQQSH